MMSAEKMKRICVGKDHQTADNGGKDEKKIVINSLNLDCLAKVIMLLPLPEMLEAEKVCTKWKEACQLSWHSIKKYKCESSIGRSYDNCRFTQSYLEEILLKFGNYLKELILSNDCDHKIMPFLGEHCKNLTTLECEFEDALLIRYADHFIRGFTQLDKLKSIKIIVRNRSIYTHMDFSSIINSLPEEINEIHLLARFMTMQKRRVYMDLERFKHLQKLTLQCVDLNIFLQVILRKTSLIHLDIQLSDSLIELYLLEKLVNLEYIDLTGGTVYAKNLTTKVLNTIFGTCRNLKHLDIPPGPYDVTKILAKHWMNLQNLEYLGISCNIMLDSADKIVNYCKNLKDLRIINFDNEFEETALKKLTELKNLECLILRDCAEVSEKSIIAISNNCKKLKRLEISECIIVPSTSGGSLSVPSVLDNLSKLKHLECLNLTNIINSGDSTIIAIANNCKNLKCLNIEGCIAKSETTFDALANMENLQRLNVGWSDSVTDNFIIKLKGLKELNCDFCQKLTNAGIIQFIENNPHLEKITVNGINNIFIYLVMLGADRVTKDRTSGVILHMIIDSSFMTIGPWITIKSEWLSVDIV